MVEVLAMGLIVGFGLVVVNEHFASIAVASTMFVVSVVPWSPLKLKFYFKKNEIIKLIVFHWSAMNMHKYQ